MHYWSTARYHFHLAESEFWALTPRQFDALQKRHKEATVHTELLNGLLCSLVVNFSMASPKTPVTAKDFMPSQAGDRPRKKPRLNRKRIANSVRGLFSGLMQAQQTK